MSTTIDWYGCYDDGWRDLIVPDAFQHPAKYRPGLIKRIYEYGFERGWWKKGDVIGDPFGGIAGGGIMAAYQGLMWFGVELEPRFCELAERNIELHRKRWEAAGDPIPEIIQGDSREFAKLVSCHCVVTSPPYADSGAGNQGSQQRGDPTKARARRNEPGDNYGKTPGQIGNLKAGELDACVTSPPYADSIKGEGADSLKWNVGARAGMKNDKMAKRCTEQTSGYGSTEGNIGNLRAIITSPPYADSVKGEHGETETAKESRDKRETPGGSLGQSQRHGGYGTAKGNIGNLKACVTSPPYAANEKCDYRIKDDDGNDRDQRRGYRQGEGCFRGSENYGETDGQIGNDKSEDYWSAMKQVYESCRQAIRPGGMLVVVVKNYVKNGKRVPLCDQTLALLESLGFVLVERIRAWVTQTTVHEGLFGEVKETKSRKSFFRRLAENKGSPSIDWEEVICVRTP